MASTSNLEVTTTSSTSSCPPITWDVFLSFYGKDTRMNFTSHLYSALDHAGILTFRDNPALEKGQLITTGLNNAIRNSKMFVVVISENYACSSWCLNELVEILDCKKTEIQVVPVFYHVDPSDVRHQKRSFGDALDYHKKRHSPETIDKWKSALAQIAAVSGYHFKKDAIENEAETIQKIVENIERQVCTKFLHLGEELYGIDSAVKNIYQKLQMESNDVRAIGICGIGGIGKTTTAKAFYNKYHTEFDSCSFIENVKKYSQGGSPLLPLVQKLLTALLRRKDYKVPDVDSGIRQLGQILCSKKALVVLDNLDQSSCSEFLARHFSLFSPGSRIVITTRDVNLLNQLKDLVHVDIYMVNELGEADSLELFNYHAFGKVTPPANLRELSKSFVTYAKCLPLALKVLGSSLRGRTQDEVFWKAKLEKVRKIPESEIMEILKLSYDELEETVKSIFLDIAFFFVGKYKDDAVDIFKSCDYYPKVGTKILLERCLITIDENNMFQMHDLIQDMGREISKSTRLFLRGNAREYLQNQKELDKIEGLILDLTQSTDKEINSQIFERLPRLRLLEIRNAHSIKGHFKNSFQELRCIYWSYCTWTRLPCSFRPQKLISINMPHSDLKMLWDEAMPFTSLKMINVNYSVNLKTTPNFGNSKSIERLFNLKTTPNFSLWKLELLRVLDLRRCSKLEQLPDNFERMQYLEELYAYSTAIQNVPDSIRLLSRLRVLDLSFCEKLKYLPDSVWNLTSLTELYLFQTDIGRINLPATVKDRKLVSISLKCNVISWLPMILSFSSLKRLALGAVGESLSSTKQFSLSKLYNLQLLALHTCTNFGSSFPDLPLNITRLFLYQHATLVHLPDLSSLKNLKDLEIHNFISLQSLPPLPPHLQSLTIYDCTSLQHLSDMSMLKELSDLNIGRRGKPKSVGLKKSFLQAVGLRKQFLPFYKVEVPTIAEWFSYKSTGRSVSIDIPIMPADNLLGLALLVRFASKNSYHFCMKADVTNKTNGTTKSCLIPVYVGITGSRVCYVVKCIRGGEISITSGDRIKILLQRQLYTSTGHREVPSIGMKVDLFAAHVIQRTLSTLEFPSVLNNLITFFVG